MMTMEDNSNAGDKPRCLECGNEIVYGRSDKKFCSNVCKNKFHNSLVQTSRGYKSRVTNALDRNYSILERLIRDGVSSADLGDLVQWGFNLEYCTSFRKTGCHDEYRCYDIKYMRTPSRIFNIRKTHTIKKDR